MYKQQMQRGPMPSFRGMQQGMSQQPGGPPPAMQMPGGPMPGGPGSGPTTQRPLPQNPWLSQPGVQGGWGGANILRGLADKMRMQGGMGPQQPQNWGDPGEGAPVIRSPGEGRGPFMPPRMQGAGAGFMPRQDGGEPGGGIMREDDERARFGGGAMR